MRRGLHRRALVLWLLIGLIAPQSAGAAQSLDGTEAQISVYRAAAEASSCDLDWSLLGGIAGFVSDHGRIYQPTPPPPISTVEAIELVGDIRAAVSHSPAPPPVLIRGDVLDGSEGTLLVRDTDGGVLDGDAIFDRAMGPFQFIPETWLKYGIDANGDGRADPDDIEDAAAAAASLLCDAGVDEDESDALVAYFGTARWNEFVTRARREIRAFEATLRPPPAIAGPTASIIAADLSVVGGIVVHNEIADDLGAMLAAAAADGISLAGSGYRTHERQIELREAHCEDVWLTPPSECSPPTAIPGTSLHETGHAIDFVDTTTGAVLTSASSQFAWLEANAADYGFTNLPSEPWHWSTTGG